MESPPTDFIRQRIQSDLAEQRLSQGVITRFPPEPNGYLHIGHAKSICLNFGVAEQFGGKTYLRFDDTNPLKESDEYVDAIKADVKWLGFQWTEVTHASDYFEEIYNYAVELIKADKAFVCSLDAEAMRSTRGSLTEPGQDSPYRGRSVDENLDLFQRMRNGEFAEGEHVLRLKIDMASPNINMRDPVIYRIRHVAHQRTGDAWCIYPMYDFTHCICDALEGISHSLCTLEFEDHRPLYDWVLDNINLNYHPPQIEFSRLGLEYTVMSKRFLIDWWTSPWSMDGMISYADYCGAASARSYPSGDKGLLFAHWCHQTRQHRRNESVGILRAQRYGGLGPRGMGVLQPLKVVLTNFPRTKALNCRARGTPKRVLRSAHPTVWS
ncbi:MAG: hypothetical protein CM15mP120_11450 [Pseudomonadota bacterium]|nr:MAG: hypothetical protein CM15mP120_11450 [Pseudomonadota bacterium]